MTSVKLYHPAIIVYIFNRDGCSSSCLGDSIWIITTQTIYWPVYSVLLALTLVLLCKHLYCGKIYTACSGYFLFIYECKQSITQTPSVTAAPVETFTWDV